MANLNELVRLGSVKPRCQAADTPVHFQAFFLFLFENKFRKYQTNDTCKIKVKAEDRLKYKFVAFRTPQLIIGIILAVSANRHLDTTRYKQGKPFIS